jgi:hypothetical protein
VGVATNAEECGRRRSINEHIDVERQERINSLTRPRGDSRPRHATVIDGGGVLEFITGDLRHCPGRPHLSLA